MKSKKIFTAALVIVSGLVIVSSHDVRATELRTYKFTSNFVDCVKSHEDEKGEYTQSGLAESGLMNGRSKIPSGAIDGNYWTYMNCLRLSESGTSNETLPTARTCDEIRFSVNGKSYYVPPSVDGKKLGLAGRFWVCQNGSWVSDSGVIDVPDGSDVTPPENNDKSPCGVSSVMTYEGCPFKITASDLGTNANGSVKTRNHGASLSVFYGPEYGDVDALSQGEGVAVCNNGSWSIDTAQSECEALSCDINETVTWAGYDGGAQLICDGNVGYGGSVTANGVAGGISAPVYSTEALARALTVIKEGSAQFSCSANGWIEVSSSCTKKPSNELVCKRAGEGYRCE